MTTEKKQQKKQEVKQELKDAKSELKQVKKEVKKSKKGLHIEVLEKISTLVTTSLGLVAALAWNEVIKSAVSYVWPKPEGSLVAGFIYAVIITTIVVVAAVYLNRIIKLTKETEESIKEKLKK